MRGGVGVEGGWLSDGQGQGFQTLAGDLHLSVTWLKESH